MRDVVREMEPTVDRLVQEGRTADAVSLLLKLVIAYSKSRNFAKAERLRDRMLQVDPMALSEIIAAGEAIEEGKSSAIDQKHLDVWSDMYARFSEEERNALYFAMQREALPPGEFLFIQGMKSEVLFFLDEGELKLAYSDETREFVLKQIRPGMVAGEETFYKTMLCGASLTAETSVTFHRLDRQALMGLAAEHPGLVPKLRDYCIGVKSATDVIREKGFDRRAHKRIATKGEVGFQVLGASGEPLSPQPLKGTLADISAGGLSFFVHTTNGSKVRKLLGYEVKMKFVVPESNLGKPIETRGRVTGVLAHLNNEYSVHVKFGTPIDPRFFL